MVSSIFFIYGLSKLFKNLVQISGAFFGEVKDHLKNLDALLALMHRHEISYQGLTYLSHTRGS